MSSVELTILTVSYNAGESLKKTLDSLYSQRGPVFNHVIQDACSDDGSLDFLNVDEYPFTNVVREHDFGIYDALNRGLSRIPIGHDVMILHAGDTFLSPNTLESLVRVKFESKSQLVYSNICFRSQSNKTVRFWRAGHFSQLKLYLGWMPPHTSILCERKLYESFGGFKTSYNISGDYEWLLRVFSSPDSCDIRYFDECTVSMDLGGLSTSGITSEFSKFKEDRLAIISSLTKYYLLVLIFKKLRKFHQYFIFRDYGESPKN